MSTNRPTAAYVEQLHQLLCFARAFPNSPSDHRTAHSKLRRFESLVDELPAAEREKLWDSGIAGTPVHYGFSFVVARWLARHAPGQVRIDWREMPDTSRLDELLSQIAHSAEDEYFDSGYLGSREWIDIARKSGSGTDFDWLMAQLTDSRLQRVLSHLFDVSDLQLVWSLENSRFSKSRNVFPTAEVVVRDTGFRGRPKSPKRAVMQPLETVELLSSRDAKRLIDVAMASLAVRHRETYHFNFANPKEVYLADVGKGVSIAIFGLLPDHRFPLECTLGYLILSNSVPIGYGGSSVVFRQANTGVNIFDEYRNSEAAYLWVQVMRVYHNLAGCTRFIADAYQFGKDNPEALKSGAFWFYYRLGYRPLLAEIRALARREAQRIRADKTYRSSITTLRRLSSCDMHLCLPGSRMSELFDERWLETSSMLAMEALGAAEGRTHKIADLNLSRALARDLGIRSFDTWSRSERTGFQKLAPIVAATNPKSWSSEDKAAMREIMRAKSSEHEVHYARLLAEHGTFLKTLKSRCRRAG